MTPFSAMSMANCTCVHFKLINLQWIWHCQYQMHIEIDKYQPNSLRKGRIEAFNQDLADAFSLFQSLFVDPLRLTFQQFSQFWLQSQLVYLLHCRGQQEDQDEYCNALHKILIHQYFMSKVIQKQIYCLFCLYFLTYEADGSGDRNLRLIYVNNIFMKELTDFINSNKDFKDQFFMRIIKNIHKFFVYSIKTGLRCALVKKNGQTFTRNTRQQRRVTQDNYSSTITQIKDELSGLEDSIRSYEEEKDKLYRKYKNDPGVGSMRKEMSYDKYAIKRIKHIIRVYDDEAGYEWEGKFQEFQENG